MVVQLNRQMDFNRLYTADEFEELDWPSDDNCYELIDGQIMRTPPRGGQEALIAHQLDRAIILFDREETLGEPIEATHFRLGAGFVPAPDLAFIKASDLASIGKGVITTAPALAVEIWSPGDLASKNRLERNRRKIRSYQLAGVSLIWGINPKETFGRSISSQ